MDLATAALSLYLLFPLYSELHYNFAQLLERNPKTNEELMEQRLELVKFIEGEEKAEEFSLRITDVTAGACTPISCGEEFKPVKIK